MKVRRGMWCEGCAGPVADQRATHRARNTALTVLEGVHCPHCGGPVRSAEERAVLEAKLDRRPRVRSDWTPAPHQSGDAAPAGNGWEAGQTVRRIPRAPREKGPLG